MPDVTIEPWMREAAKQIDDYANTYDFMDAEPEESQILFARAIATAYAAREQDGELRELLSNVALWMESALAGHKIGLKPLTIDAWRLNELLQELKSALAGETR